MKNIHKVLISMGYRKLNKSKYIKPIGYNVFTFNLDTLEFLNMFKSADDKIHVYNSEKYEKDEDVKDDFLQFIKHVENYSNLVDSNYSNFEFLTLEDQIFFSINQEN